MDKSRRDPEEAKFCPECRQPLTGMDLEAHAQQHWPDYIDPRTVSADAARRKGQVRAGGVAQGELP